MSPRSIIEEREANGPFTDFHDFCARVDPAVLNKRTVESLVRGGGFDSLGHTRRGLCLVFEPIVDAALRRRREREQGTMSLFDLGADAGDPSPVFDDRLEIPDLEFDKTERLRLEKEMLGLYVSDHPLMGAERALRRYVECSIADLADMDDGTMRTVAGVVTALSRKYTKRGDLMATFVLEDIASSIEVMVFPKTMAQYNELLAPDAIVTVKGRIDGREDTVKLMALEIALARDPSRQRSARAHPGQGQRPHRRARRPAQGDPRRVRRRQSGVPAPRRRREGNRAPAR